MKPNASVPEIEVNIFDTIRTVMDQLPKKQKKLCKYILEFYQSVGMLTVKELADAAGVGTTTVMRLVQTLGFSSYINMRKAIHKTSLQSPPNIWWTLEESFKHKRAGSEDPTRQTWQEIQYILEKTCDDYLQQLIEKTVDLLIEARQIHILGLRSSRPIADYFYFLLEQFYPKANQLSFDSEMIFERILRFKPEDILFITTFHPYSSKTLEAAEYARNRGIRIILLTDYLVCPIAQYADLVLKVEPSRLQYSIVPAIAMIETIIIELGRRTANDSIRSLKELDTVLKGQRVNYLG